MTQTGPPDLSCLQQWMQAVLVTPLGNATRAPHTYLPDHMHHNAVESVVCSSKRMTAREHLALYQRSYLLRLRGCMEEQFPALKTALGDALFQGFADDYLQSCPPDSYTLAHLGRRFPDYLQETRPDKDQPEDWPDFLIELARFEFSLAELFDAHEPPAPEGDGPLLLPLVRLFKHRFPVLAYYRAAIADKKPELPLPQTTYGLIVRKNYRTALVQLQEAQYRLLSLMKDGFSLSEARQQLAHHVDPSHLGAILPQWLKRWEASGIILANSKPVTKRS